MIKIMPYLMVENGKEAIKYYEELFGAKLIDHSPFTPETGKGFGYPDDYDYENSTMHATLKIEDVLVYLSDNGYNLPTRGNVEVLLAFETLEQIEEIYSKVKELNCEISMELNKTFWGSYFARFVDKFGVGWMLNYTPEKE